MSNELKTCLKCGKKILPDMTIRVHDGPVRFFVCLGCGSRMSGYKVYHNPESEIAHFEYKGA